MVSYNESIYFDRAISYAHDIHGSIAFARGNQKVGILTAEEFAAIEKGFKQVQAEWESGKFEIKPGVDIFTLRMNADSVRSLVLPSLASYIPGEVVMIRSGRG